MTNCFAYYLKYATLYGLCVIITKILCDGEGAIVGNYPVEKAR
jgi:hypothetical protein